MAIDQIIDFRKMREVTTKFGTKPIYGIDFKSGATCEYGFKNPEKNGLSIGMMVNYETEYKYGNEVIKSIYAAGAGATPVAGTSGSPPASPPTRSGGRYDRVFPVPIDSGERAILRQNALTNAREFVCNDIMTKAGAVKGFTWSPDDEQVQRILDIAAKFEEYTSGDLERRAAEKMVAEGTK